MSSRYLVINVQNALVFILFSYALVVSLFIDAASRNYLVLFAALLGGLLFLPLKLSLHPQSFWAIKLFLIMVMQSFFVSGVSDLESVALTFVYALGYFAISGLLQHVQDKKDFIQNVMRKIIYAFAILSIVQMVASFIGLPIPNLILSKGLWSYNSFAFEPSHVGRVVGISMLCYLLLARLPTSLNGPEFAPRNDLKIWGAFLTTMFLSGSSLAAVAVLTVVVFSRSISWSAVICTLSILFWPVVFWIDFEPLQRMVVLISNLKSLDVDQILDAEQSGGIRIAAAIIYLEDASANDLGFWFGYGKDGLARFLQYRIAGLGDTVGAGFMPGFAIVYGTLITVVFVWIFALSQVNRTTVPLIAFWVIFFFSSAWNTQVFWYCLIVIQISYAASCEDAFSLKRAR